MHREVVSEEDLRTVGDALWRALDIDEAFAQARERGSQQVLPLIIESTDPALLTLPWECLHHPEYGFLGRHSGFTLLRQVLRSEPLPPPKGPLRVLLFTSLPDDLDAERERLDVESEQGQVIEALDPLVREGRAVLEVPDDGRFSMLKRRLRDEEFHLVVLSGHGSFEQDPAGTMPPRSVFYFEGEDGRSAPVEAQEIAQAFVGVPVRAVVLSACQSGKSSSEDLHTGLTLSLLKAGVPHVVGMREPVLDIAGTRFARALCDALARQERLDVAVQQARADITQPLSAQGVWRDPVSDGRAEVSLGQWCLPLLYSRAPAQVLIDWGFTPKPPAISLFRYHELAGLHLPTRFIGRRKELRELGQALASRETRQVLITGAGGQGKTSLAGRLAERLEHQGYRVVAYNGRLPNAWEDFRSLFESALYDFLGEDERKLLEKALDNKSEGERARLLLSTFMRKTANQLVLLLDNLESVQDPKTTAPTDVSLSTWLEACRKMGKGAPLVLATSRWCLPGWERRYRKHHPLARPSYGDFLRYHQELSCTARERDTLRQLYRAFGGNFKGLEFFEALGKTDADEQAFLTQLEDAKEELQLYMAIEAVVGQLTDPERELLHRLCAYTAPVIVDGVETLALDFGAITPLLDRLAALSLVEVEVHSGLQLPRYQVYPIVAEWLAQQRGPLPQDTLARAAHYQVHAFHELTRTLGQALTAHEALKGAGHEEEAARLALDYLLPDFERRGMYRTLLKDWLPQLTEMTDPDLGAQAYKYSANAHRLLGRYDSALKAASEALTLWQQIDDRLGQGIALVIIGQIHGARADYKHALEYLERALALAQEIRDPRSEGVSLHNIGVIAYSVGNYDSAFDYYSRALTVFRELGDLEAEAAGLNSIGNVHRARGDYDAALKSCGHALLIQERLANQEAIGYTLNTIGEIHRLRGDYAAALRNLKQALAVRQTIGHRKGEGTTRNNLGLVYFHFRDFENALFYLECALKIRQEIGDRLGENVTLGNMGAVYQAFDKHHEAVTLYKRSIDICTQLGDRQGMVANLVNIGVSYSNQGDYDRALQSYDEALAISRGIGDRVREAGALANIGSIYFKRGDYATALDYNRRALTIYEKIGDQVNICSLRIDRGNTLITKGDLQQARTELATAYVIAKRLGLPSELTVLQALAKKVGLGGPKGLERLGRDMRIMD